MRFEVTNRSAGAYLIERRLDLPSAYSQVGGGAVPAALPNGHAADSRPLHPQLAPATSEGDPKGIRRTLCRRESILCPMDRERIVERYFDAWIARDALAIVSTFTDGGTYLDPTTPVALVGDAIGEYARRLWSAFPDLTFEIRKRTGSGRGDLAAEWTMRGTNDGPFGGLPPTGRRVVVEGADFIRVDDSGIRSVHGYFDPGAVPRQLGLQVVVQPHAAGPFTFGTSSRVGGRTSGVPGAFSLTAVYTRSEADAERVRAYSREIAAELPHVKGFMGWVGATVGDRMMTITAWETPDDPRQLTTGRRHAEAMRAFFGSDLTAGGWTSVWVPERLNSRWRRCAVCGRIASGVGSETRCDCGALFGEAPSYW